MARHRCPCGKKRFRDHLEATRALHTIGNNALPGSRRPIRSYECHRCGGWHLTSQRTWGADL